MGGVATRGSIALLLVLLTGCANLDGLSERDPASQTHASGSSPTTPPPSDAPLPAATPRCDAASPFTSAVAIGTSVFGARWDAKKTMVVFNAGDGSAPELRVGSSLTVATSAPFTPIVPHPSGAPQPQLLFPALTEDGLVLYYQQYTPFPDQPGFGTSQIFRARRANLDHQFHDAQPALPTSTMDFAPYYVAAAHALYFTHVDTNNNAHHVMRWAIDGSGDPVEVFVSTASSVSEAVVSDDELTLYYADSRGGSMDVFVARRSTTKEQFANGTKLDALNTQAHDEVPTWISPDQCELVYEKSDGTSRSSWSATRSPSSAP